MVLTSGDRLVNAEPHIAVLLLCHELPSQVAFALTSPFYSNGSVKVYIHYDARRSDAQLEELARLIPSEVLHTFVKQRVACAWGDFSLVDATHRLMRAAIDDKTFSATHLLLCSASCAPIRPVSSLQQFLLRRAGIDFIQAVDVSRRRWVKGGLEKERYEFRFPFNFQTQRWAFERFTALQRRLGMRRQPPDNLKIYFGSQWFCLTQETAQSVANRLELPSLRKFFAASWIPDEFAVQSLVMSVQRPERVAGHNLTYYEFDEQGRPLVLENGHFEHLLRQPFFFARKMSPNARLLVEKIHQHLKSSELDYSYFARAGSPSGHYAKFLAAALTANSARARVAAIADSWRGVMDLNERPYILLYASSRRLVAAVAQKMRELDPLQPTFDFVFDPLRLVPASEVATWRGIQSGMRARRDHDPAAFAHELIHIDPDRPTVMCLDAAVPSWLRDFALWDPLATVISCDPRGVGKLQRAEAASRDIDGLDEAALLDQTVRAAATPGWLPQDYFEEARRESKHRCRLLAVDAIRLDEEHKTLRAIKMAWDSVDSYHFFAPTEAEAGARLLGQGRQ